MFKRKISDESFQNSIKSLASSLTPLSHLAPEKARIDPETGEIFQINSNQISQDVRIATNPPSTQSQTIMSFTDTAKNNTSQIWKSSLPSAVLCASNLIAIIGLGIWMSYEIKLQHEKLIQHTKRLESSTHESTFIAQREESQEERRERNERANSEDALKANYPLVNFEKNASTPLRKTKPVPKPSIKDVRYLGLMKQEDLSYVALQLANQAPQLFRIGDLVRDSWRLSAIDANTVLLSHPQGHQTILKQESSRP